MKGRAFPVLVFVLMAIAVHLAYILFVPNGQIAQRLTAFAAQHGTNRFVVLAPEISADLFKEIPGDTLVALCAFDLESGPVKISAPVIGRYWSLTVYSPAGEILYTLNDRQAAAASVDLTVKSGSADVQQSDNLAQTRAPSEGSIRSPEQSGFISVRSAVDLPNEQTYLAKVLKTATCSS